jgi:hypothetical protein
VTAIIPDDMIQAMRGPFNLGLFFRLDTSPALHLWWGVTDKAAAIENVDADGTIYQGAGTITEIPDTLEVLLNGASERVDFRMDGVNADLVAQLAADAPAVGGKKVHFGFAILDEKWQLVSKIFVPWVGQAEAWSDNIAFPSSPDERALASISLITSSGSQGRAVADISTYTDRVQKIISPTDDFCSRVSRYYQQLLIKWPQY